MTDTILSPSEVAAAANKEITTFAIHVPEPEPPVKPPKWDWCTHVCSIFTMLCCCWCLCFSSLCGLVGLVLSIGSYTDYKSQDYDRYKYKKGCAIGFTIIGIVLGLGTLAAAGYMGYTQGPTWYQMAKDWINAQINSFTAPLIQQIKDAIPTIPPQNP